MMKTWPVVASLLLAVTGIGSAAAQTAPAAAAHASFVSAGARLAYTAYGRGPAVIVLAGGPGLNAAYMAPLARTIAGDGYRALLLDQRGTGASAAAGRDRAMLGVRGTVADIEAMRRAAGIARVTFVTHSFGGGMALAYAAVHPAHVAKLILIGSVGTDLDGVDRFGQILMTHLTPAERARYAADQRRNDGAAALDLQLLAEFDDRRYARAVIASEPRPFVYDDVSNAVYSDFTRSYHVAAAMRAVHARVTLLTGADDAARVMEPSLDRAFPAATRIDVPHSGHWPWIENAAVFEPALRAALGA